MQIVQFNSSPDFPTPLQWLLYEHFKQAVLANIKGTGEPQNHDFDPIDDKQTVTVFEKNSEKDWFKTLMSEKLAPYEDYNL